MWCPEARRATAVPTLGLGRPGFQSGHCSWLVMSLPTSHSDVPLPSFVALKWGDVVSQVWFIWHSLILRSSKVRGHVFESTGLRSFVLGFG